MKKILIAALCLFAINTGFAQSTAQKKVIKKSNKTISVKKDEPKKIEQSSETDEIEIDEMANNGKTIRKEIKATINDSGIPGKKTLRIEKNINGKVMVTEKQVNEADLRDGLIMEEMTDTLSDGKLGHNPNIMMEEDDSKFNWEDGNIHHSDADGVGVFNRRYNLNRDELNYQFDRFQDHLAQIPQRWNEYNPFNGNRNWFNEKRRFSTNEKEMNSVHDLEVYTNKPDKEVINVRFFANDPGTANITVIDPKGEVVAKSETKKIEGEYVGQVKLNAIPKKGTYFVIVTLNGDGSSRKIKID